MVLQTCSESLPKKVQNEKQHDLWIKQLSTSYHRVQFYEYPQF
jgi:hypothetical protein